MIFRSTPYAPIWETFEKSIIVTENERVFRLYQSPLDEKSPFCAHMFDAPGKERAGACAPLTVQASLSSSALK